MKKSHSSPLKKKIFFTALLCLFLFELKAQNMFDATVGTSNQDQVFVNLALRRQFSEKFRLGVDVHSGLVNYRFIGAKVIDEGVSTSINIPLMLRIHQRDRLRLDFYNKVGLRFQSVSSDYEQDKDLQASSSVGVSFEPGLLATFALSEKLSIQSGVTLPNLFEISPEFIYENNVTNLVANVGYKLSDTSLLMLKAGTGPAAGADGDSQKYTWSVQVGLRFLLGKNHPEASLITEPSF